MKNKFGQFEKMIKDYIYNMNCCALQEMGASEEMLKAYGEYKEASIAELQNATQYVAVWQQAKMMEAVKESYVKAQRQQEKAEADNEEKRGFSIAAASEIKRYLS